VLTSLPPSGRVVKNDNLFDSFERRELIFVNRCTGELCKAIDGCAKNVQSPNEVKIWGAEEELVSFRLSYRVLSSLRLQRKPMIGNTRQNAEILVPKRRQYF
jgi:hypothetical protein